MKVNVDKIGAYAGAICAVHCVLSGVALGLLSWLGVGFIGSETSEAAFVGTAVVLGIVAIVHGRRRHHSYLPAMVFAFGMACIVASHLLFGHQHLRTGGVNVGSAVFSGLGGLSLVVFHVMNQRLAHRCGCNHCRTGN